MTTLLAVEDLSKRYPGFALEGVSFSLEAGHIMGLIGTNGAGKSTTIKAMLNLVCPDSGTIRLMGRDFRQEEANCKQELGVVLGGADAYPRKRLAEITAVTRRFYPAWDQAAYARCLARFGLDERKQVSQLSNGMKVKYQIALALSHRARLLILDEPTSGLDPVARDDLLELFHQLVREGERAILFSTHITSDLEKCADQLTYLKKGRVLASGEMRAVLQRFQMLRRPGETGPLTLEEIMVRTEREVS